ncbi:MAG: polyphosphate kinase 2, partial [Arenimonas sp.]
DEGILLFKYWLSVDQEEQEERFAERVKDPTKRWKLSPIDVLAREKYEEYGKARDEMFHATHTKFAPWTVVDFNSQKQGRITMIQDLLKRIPDHKLPDVKVEFLPLKTKPKKEKFNAGIKPI